MMTSPLKKVKIQSAWIRLKFGRGMFWPCSIPWWCSFSVKMTSSRSWWRHHLRGHRSKKSKIQSGLIVLFFNFKFIRDLIYDGDLFDSNDSLTHCVSSDLRMGRGITVLFRQKFKRIDDLLRQQVHPGGCAILPDWNRFIYYLVTKKRCFEKPTYDSLNASLCVARNHCVQHNITNLSIPQIGCGLDGLKWKEVSKLIESVFGRTNVKITVYIRNSHK